MEELIALNRSANHTFNSTYPTMLSFFSRETTTFYYCAFSLMFVIGSVGNSAVIYIITLKHQNKKSNFDIYIISLAITDLLASIFLPVVMIHDLYTEWNHWHLGSFGCKILVPMPHINSLVSALMLVVISFDRLRVIRQTSLKRRSRRITIAEVVVVWIISILIVSPYIYFLEVQNGFCKDHWERIYRFVYYTVLQFFSCFFPIIIMIATYATSAHILLHNKFPGDSVYMMKRRRRKQNQRVTQMFGIIVIIFFVMTTPYMISFFIVAYYGTFDIQTYRVKGKLLFDLQYAFYTLMGFNACINPFIYAMRYKDISRTFKRFLSTQRSADKMKRKYGVVKMVDRKYGFVGISAKLIQQEDFFKGEALDSG
ncbi:galanin receptor 2b-like [Clytia hemisphaerica]|uniref:G-protein coupled receptors family 1 profile domain-containing protein n=1 Tax=Clytia hemisphaerica TaxID=252671 RepID=A0A7M6DLZ0_9CNID|eukprot:TCONS_00014502-protein